MRGLDSIWAEWYIRCELSVVYLLGCQFESCSGMFGFDEGHAIISLVGAKMTEHLVKVEVRKH